MKKSAEHFLVVCFLFVTSLALSGCGGGSKLLKDPIEVEIDEPLASANDAHLIAHLNWIIVKNGPGTWAKNAHWDEYLVRVVNRSEGAFTITGVKIVDALDVPVEPQADRKQLVRSSKKTAKRYRDYDLDVRPGAGSGVLVAAGTTSFLVASGMAAAAAAEGAIAALFGQTATTSASTAAAGTALAIAGPVLIVGGIVKASNNSKVNKEIISRHAEFPLELDTGEDLELNVFFPVSPAPRAVQIAYSTAEGEQVLNIDTSEVLYGLHLESSHGSE